MPPKETFDRARLSHVLWMGGSPCSGKSTWANVLAEQYGIAIYHVDTEFPRHAQRFTPEQHPTLYRWTHTPWDALWMQSDEALLQQAIAAYTEHFSLILQDLLETDPSVPLLSEGTALLPGCVPPLLSDKRRALWVVPSEAFQRQMYPQRNFVQSILSTCRDPDRAFQNWMHRDANFARWVAAEARTLSLHVLENDGTRTVAANTSRVADYFRLSGQR